MRELMTLDIVARDEASPVVQKVSASAKAAAAATGLAYKQASIRALTYSKVLRGLSRGLTIYGVASLAVAAYAGKQAATFQRDMGLVRTQSDLTNKQFAALNRGVLKLASNTSRPIQELTQGLYDIFSGINTTGPGAVKMLGQISKAAVSGNTDIRTVTRSVISELNAFGLSTKSTNKVLDQQFQMLRYSQGTYSELVTSLGNVISSSHQAGQSLTEMNNAVGFLTKTGMSFSMASISAARAMDWLTRPAISDKLKSIMGVDIVNAQGNFKKLSVIMSDMAAKLKGMTKPEMKKALSDVWGNGEIRANRFFNAVLPRIKDYIKNLHETARFHGALGNAYDKLKNTAAVAWGKLVNNVKIAAIEIGNVLLPALTKFISGIAKAFAWITKLDPATKATIGKFLIWGGVIALVAGRLAKLGAGLLSITSMRLWSGAAADAAAKTTMLQGATASAATTVPTLGRALLGTIGRFALWGAVIGGAAYLIIKNWGIIKQWFSGFVNWWKVHWRQIWDTVKPVVDGVAKAFLQILKIGATVFGGVVKVIGQFIAKMLLIKPVVQGVVVFLLTIIAVKLVQGIVSALTSIVVAFRAWSISMLAVARANWILLLVAAIVTAAYLIISNWSKVKDFFTKVFNGLARDAAAVGNFFIRFLVNPIIQGVNTILHALNALSLGFAHIPTLAPVSPIKMPGKYISNLGGAASGASSAASATGDLSKNAQSASVNIHALNQAISDYMTQAERQGKASGFMDKSIRNLRKSLNAQVQTVNKGTSGYFDLNQAINNLMAGPWGNGKVTNAARLQAAALKQAYSIQVKHLESMMKSNADGAQWAKTLANMGDVSLKAKTQFAGLWSVSSQLGVQLSKNQLTMLNNAVRTHDLGAANKMLAGIIQGVTDKINGVPTKHTTKISADTSSADAGVKHIQNALYALERQRVHIGVDISSLVNPYALGQQYGQALVNGFRVALQAHSPSRVFMAIGKDIIKGLIIGLRDAVSLRHLKGQVNNIVDIVKALPAMLSHTFRLLRQGTSASLNAATNGFQRFTDRLGKLRDQIKTLHDTITSHISDIRKAIKDLDKAINDKSTKAAERAKDILNRTALSERLKQWMDVSKLPNTLGGVAKKLTSWGNDLQRRMTALNARVQSFTSDFRSGFQQGTDIVSILGGETKANINVRTFFSKKIKEARQWTNVLKQLAHQGLNRTLLQELAAAGPDALPLARQMLLTGVHYINRRQGELNKIMGTTQKYLVNTVFGDQIDQLARDAKHFRNALKSLANLISKTVHDAEHPQPHHHQHHGHGGAALVLNYNVSGHADAKELVRELSWFWRKHKHGT